MKKQLTHISQAFWCDPERDYMFEQAQFSLGDSEGGEEGGREKAVSWLDTLFMGGIALPDTEEQEKRAITLLITGPPGTGKSTLATELCYRWAMSKDPLTTYYVTTEGHGPWMIENAKKLNWTDVDRVFGSEGGDAISPVSIFEVRRESELRQWAHNKPGLVETARDVLGPILELLGINPSVLSSSSRKAKPESGRRAGRGAIPHVVVIDSLNTIPEREDRAEIFRHFMQIAELGPKILIVILDSTPDSRAADFWEFTSDVVIRLDREYPSGYMIRNIEILKARYQVHKWGKHQLKIYEPSRVDGKEPLKKAARGSSRDDGEESSKEAKEASRRMRSHPFRREGGIFIFPSIHYYLSEYKRKSPIIKPEPIDSPVMNLNRALYGGFPMGRCVGLIGTRGGHKSHLGYLELLHRIVDQPPAVSAGGVPATPEILHKALVISLRDDEGMTRDTMEKILKQHWPERKIDLWEDLEKKGLLEVMYYPPGYITPEEFFHRLLLSIKRMNRDENRSRKPHITLLFNSLDQLASRFPLCAREEIFIPGVIQMLSAEEVSSFFVGAKEVGQPEEYYGLLSMAELILSLDRKSFAREEYLGFVQRAFGEHSKTPEFAQAARNFPEEHNAVLLSVVRYAGGQAAGASGILELVNKQDFLFPLYGQQGLVFVPRTGANVSSPSPAAAGMEGPSR
ncbi:MAG: ATPase domain-containing protein [Candidatus Eisenbacteria bacterium]